MSGRRLVCRLRLLAALATLAAISALAGTGAAAQAPRTVPQPQGRTLSISTDHLTATATLTPLELPQGGRMTLTANISPKTGMHVYAPGSRYHSVTIKLAANSPFTFDSPVTYPKPATYTFKPLNEEVPVYDTPFRLVAQVVLDAARPHLVPLRRPLPVTLKGSLDYQACDQRYCYLPESLPLRWTIVAIP
jgi:hypothetical protein